MSKALYKMSMPHLKELHVQMEELLKNEYILPNILPWGDLMLFARKKDGILRLCMDYI